MKSSVNTAILGILFLTMSANARIGGTTGGGGNISAEKQLSSSQIEEAVLYSKAVVLTWANGVVDEYLNTQQGAYCDTLCQKRIQLLKTKPNIFSAINQVQIKLQQNDSCHDQDGQHKDGSVDTSKPNSICISISHLKNKLTTSNYKAQTAALVLHEITHLTGSTESDAVSYQNDLLEKLKIQSFDDVLSSIYKNIKSFREISDSLNQSVALILDQGFDGQCKTFNELSETVHTFGKFNLQSRSNLSFISPSFMGSFWSSYVKLAVLSDYICSQDQWTHDQEEKTLAQERYQYIFSSNDAIPTHKIMPAYKDRADGGIYANKVSSKTSVYNEIYEIKTHLDQAQADYENLYIENRFPVKFPKH